MQSLHCDCGCGPGARDLTCDLQASRSQKRLNRAFQGRCAVAVARPEMTIPPGRGLLRCLRCCLKATGAPAILHRASICNQLAMCEADSRFSIPTAICRTTLHQGCFLKPGPPRLAPLNSHAALSHLLGHPACQHCAHFHFGHRELPQGPAMALDGAGCVSAWI